MEESLYSLFLSAPYIVSLLAGILTFFSPCVLPLVPAYLSYISGLSIQEMTDNKTEHKLKILRASLLFISGFGIIFILLGASMASLIEDIFAYSWVSYIAGGIIIIFGLHTMGVIRIKFLMFEKRADLSNITEKSKFKNFLKSFAPFLLGVSFALGWTPCIGPIFAAIVSMAAQEEAKGLTLMIIYTIGLAIPFVVSALLTQKAMNFFNRVKQNFRVVEYVSGILLIIIGIAIATGGLGELSNILSFTS
jgi:cytochrome c-type biogenesis protein